MLSRSFTKALSSYSPPIKLLPFSDVTIFTCPCLAINRLRANINDSVVRLSTISRCNALIVDPESNRVLTLNLFSFISVTYTGKTCRNGPRRFDLENEFTLPSVGTMFCGGIVFFYLNYSLDYLKVVYVEGYCVSVYNHRHDI